MHALIKLKKYRVMKQRYGSEDKDFDGIQRDLERKGVGLGGGGGGAVIMDQNQTSTFRVKPSSVLISPSVVI